MQVYVDDDGDKVGVVEKGERIEFVDFVDFGSVFDFPHEFDFSFDFSRCLGNGEVLTLYKKKADKVRPVNQPHEGGLRPGGKGNWRAEAISKEKYKPDGDYGGWLIPKFSDIKKGSRLTAERIGRLKVGGVTKDVTRDVEGVTGLTANEYDVFLQVLYNREAGIAFDFTEKGRFIDDVEPPHAIPTIPHTP
jgi:hypothetical protein